MHVGEQPETTTTTRTTIIEIQVEIKMEIKTLPKMAVQRVKTASHNHLFVCIILVVPPSLSPSLYLSAILCRILFLDVFHSSLQQQKKTTNIHNKHEWVYDICNIQHSSAFLQFILRTTSCRVRGRGRGWLVRGWTESNTSH